MAVAISDLPSETIKVIRSRKWTWFFLFLLVSFAVLVIGIVFPKKYQAFAVIKVSDRNVLNPLMKGQAVAGVIPDRASAILDVLNSRELLVQLSDLDEIWGHAAVEGRLAGPLAYFKI